MGLDLPAYKFLSYCSRGNPLGSTLTLGRQSVHLKPDQLLAAGSSLPHLQWGEFCEGLLISDFSASQVHSVDASGFEGASYIHDLNQPLEISDDQELYDTLIDMGTLEHVFNVPIALQSMANFCKIGGQIIHIQVHNDFSGHGFWQFSPELFFSLYSPQNGFRGTEIFLHTFCDQAWFKCLRPRLGKRLELTGRNVPTSYIAVRTFKNAAVTKQSVLQSDYLTAWKANEDASAEAEESEDLNIVHTSPNAWWHHPFLQKAENF